MITYNIEEKYNSYLNVKSGWGVDMTEHMPTLRRYASECDHIIEMGVRSVVSTWAFLIAKPKKLIGYDITPPNTVDYTVEIEDIVQAAKLNGTEFIFKCESTLTAVIEETDLLFIDTLHNYEQLIYELTVHGNKARKYIILHDTKTFGLMGETSPNGLDRAIREFLEANSNWKIKEVYDNCNGLTVLERCEA